MENCVFHKCYKCNSKAHIEQKKDENGMSYVRYVGNCEDCLPMCEVILYDPEGKVETQTKWGEVQEAHQAREFYRCNTCGQYRVCRDCYLYQYKTETVECFRDWFNIQTRDSIREQRNRMVCFMCGSPNGILKSCLRCSHFVCENCSLIGSDDPDGEVRVANRIVCNDCSVYCKTCDEHTLLEQVEKCKVCQEDVCQWCIEGDKHKCCERQWATSVVVYDDIYSGNESGNESGQSNDSVNDSEQH
jgi:hypothetical protein